MVLGRNAELNPILIAPIILGGRNEISRAEATDNVTEACLVPRIRAQKLDSEVSVRRVLDCFHLLENKLEDRLHVRLGAQSKSIFYQQDHTTIPFQEILAGPVPNHSIHVHVDKCSTQAFV